MKLPTEDSATVFGDGASPESATVALTGTHSIPVDGITTGMGAMMEEVREAGGKSMGLATKYFFMAAGLIAATIGTAVAITAYRANVVADETVRRALSQVDVVWSSFMGEREMNLRGTIRTLADEPQTRAILGETTVSAETVKDWTADKISAAGAAFLAVLDAQGAFIARNDKPVEDVAGRPVNAPFVKEALAGKDSSALVREGDRVFIVAAAPVVSGEGEAARLGGVLFAGYPLDDASAQRISTLSGSDATFLTAIKGEGGKLSAKLAASTVEDGNTFLSDLTSMAAGPLDKLLAGETVGPLDIHTSGDHLIAVGFPLKTGSGDVIGAFVASRSLKQAKAAFTQIQNTLIVVGIISLVFAVPASYVFGRRIASPLMRLAASALAVREGNLNVEIPQAGGDEVGLLARSFAQMVSELKEKAELEKFVGGLGIAASDITQGRITAAKVTAAPAATGEVPVRRPVGEAKLEPGAVLGGRYVVESILGQGGMGSVWRARDRELEEPVALKVIRNDMLVADPTLADRLKDEIRLARRITHPNILRTHDFGDLDGVRFISMEFVPGPTLRTVIDKRGQLQLAVGLTLGRQICRGLAAAHDAGVIHRDIKPHNIIIAPNGTVKIMDFGIALSHEKPDAMGEGSVVGTPDYMAPEQIEGRAVDARSDVYALGVVLFEMFTGVRPFHAETTVQTLMRNLNEDLPPLRKLRPDLPAALEQLIAQSTAKSPDERIQTAQAMKKALGNMTA